MKSSMLFVLLSACVPGVAPVAEQEDALDVYQLTFDCRNADLTMTPNLATNPTFTAFTAPTSQTTSPAAPMLTLPSAAGSWYARNGSAGTTSTEVVSTPYGPALHVITTGANSGVLQQLSPPGTGPSVSVAAASVQVISGQVGVLIGATGQGGTSNTTVWHLEEHPTPIIHPLGGEAVPAPLFYAPNDSAPANQVGFLSLGGPAEFYLYDVRVHACSGIRALSATAGASFEREAKSCDGVLHLTGAVDFVAEGGATYVWRFIDAYSGEPIGWSVDWVDFDGTDLSPRWDLPVAGNSSGAVMLQALGGGFVQSAPVFWDTTCP